MPSSIGFAENVLSGEEREILRMKIGRSVESLRCCRKNAVFQVSKGEMILIREQTMQGYLGLTNNHLHFIKSTTFPNHFQMLLRRLHDPSHKLHLLVKLNTMKRDNNISITAEPARFINFLQYSRVIRQTNLT